MYARKAHLSTRYYLLKIDRERIHSYKIHSSPHAKTTFRLFCSLCSHAPFRFTCHLSLQGEVFPCYTHLFTLQRYGGQGYAKNHSYAIRS